jgi:hypothetical protein
MPLGQQHLHELDVDFNLAGRAIHYGRQHRALQLLRTSARQNPRWR